MQTIQHNNPNIPSGFLRLQKNHFLKFLPNVLIALGFLLNSAVYAQKKTPDIEFEFRLRKAEAKFNSGDYYDALPDFQWLVLKKPTDAELNYRLGFCIMATGDDRLKAIPYLEYAASSGILKAHFYVGQLFHLAGNFDRALGYYGYFKANAPKSDIKRLDVDRHIAYSLSAKEMVAHPVKAVVKNAGSQINTKDAEYIPLVTADDSTLYFTSRREDSRGGKKDNRDRFFEDIYVSRKQENGEWGEPKNVGQPVNSVFHDATTALSPDGQLLMIYRNEPFLGGGDLYNCVKEGVKWETPFKLGLQINTGYNDLCASLTTEGNILYFSSDRPGGLGGLDIYRSVRRKNGTWGPPENLGPNINTAYDEDAPFIMPGDKMLYFSSKGRDKNMGGYDFFVSKRGLDNRWEKPENLGYPVNSTDNDLYLCVLPDNSKGYFSGQRKNGSGDRDIYEVDFGIHEAKYTLVYGWIHTPAGDPVQARITLTEPGEEEEYAHFNSDGATGKFIFLLPQGKDYKLKAEAHGYKIYRNLVSTQEEDKPLDTKLLMIDLQYD